MTIPSVNIIVADNGPNASISLPQEAVQVVIACSVGGTPLIPFATTLADRLKSEFVGGPLVQAGGLVCSSGGTVIALPLPIANPGTKSAVEFTGTGASVITATIDDADIGAWDDMFIRFRVVTGGTIGTAGIQFRLSLDAGRNEGPLLNLGTALTYAIPETGITLNFAAGDLDAGDIAQLSTVAPSWDSGDVTDALNALAASPFAQEGWGSMHLVGVSSSGNVSTFDTAVDGMRDSEIFTRIITSARDALVPTAWGGSGETEAAWMTSIETAFSATNAKRTVVCAGYYNMPSAYRNLAAGTPAYRRSCAWAAAVRRTGIPPQRTTWRVRDGSLRNIAVDPSVDPFDGFVYHDERTTPGLDAARFLSLRTWPKKQGYFVCKDNLMSEAGSQYTILPIGNVIDLACTIGYATAVDEIGDDLRIKPNGRLFPADALSIQNKVQGAEDTGLTNNGYVSSILVALDQSTNVQSTGNIPIAITVTPKGYVQSITETIGVSIPNAAPTA